MNQDVFFLAQGCCTIKLLFSIQNNLHSHLSFKFVSFVIKGTFHFQILLVYLQMVTKREQEYFFDNYKMSLHNDFRQPKKERKIYYLILANFFNTAFPEQKKLQDTQHVAFYFCYRYIQSLSWCYSIHQTFCKSTGRRS